jgi:2,4-diaminobutyrate 4-transaminase
MKIDSQLLAERPEEQHAPDLAEAARSNAFARLIRCLFAERILNPADLSWSSNHRQAWLPLQGERGHLHFADLRRLPADTYHNLGAINLQDAAGTRQILESPAALIALLSNELSAVAAPGGIQALIDDIADSIENDILARRHRRAWNTSLAWQIRASGCDGLVSYLANAMPLHEAAMLLDQWGAIEGHPFYPTWKSKPGLSAAEIEALAPEFGSRVNLRIAALRRDWAQVEIMPPVADYRDWFARSYPDVWTAWSDRNKLRDDPDRWLPLPIHLWHLENFVRQEFAAEIASDVLDIDGPDLLAIPSMSFRTVLPDGPAPRPFIKLPVALWMTSEQRTLPARAVHMGPRMSMLLCEILAQDAPLRDTLEICREEVGVILQNPQTGDEHAGCFLSVVYRDTGTIARHDELMPVTVAALFAASPLNGRPLLCELVAKMSDKSDAAAEFLRAYAMVILRPVITMYMKYGIALEAHQQNSVVLFDADGRPRKLVIRDLGDSRSFAPLFEARGFHLKRFQKQGVLPTTFEDDISLVRSFLIDACFVCHLHEIALCLNEQYGLNEAWSILRKCIRDVCDLIKPEVPDDGFWAVEKKEFLHEPWPCRSVLRMHLERYGNVWLYHDLTNPTGDSAGSAIRNVLPNSERSHRTVPLPARADNDEHAIAPVRYLAKVESAARTYASTFTKNFVSGAGIRVRDDEGNDYIDCLACAGALPLGHNHPEVTQAVMNFIASGHLQQGLDLTTPAKFEFTRELFRTLPAGFRDHAKIQFCGPTGSDAVEAAIKLMRYSTKRFNVLAFHGAYHGMTAGSLSAMGKLEPKAVAGTVAAGVHFAPYPYRARCPFGTDGTDTDRLSINYIETLLSDPESGIQKPACILLEAVQGEGGCIPASDWWLGALHKLSQRYDVPLVIDEVQTGFGRTGTMFACERAGITPDALVLSKAVGGGYPLAVLVYHERHDIWPPGSHAGTFRGNQIAMVAGRETMKIIARDRLAQNAAVIGEALMQGLHRVCRPFPFMGEIRGRGLMIGVEVVTPSQSGPRTPDGVMARTIKQMCFQEGLIIETGGRGGAVLRFLPPLTVCQHDIDEILRRFESALGVSFQSVVNSDRI